MSLTIIYPPKSFQAIFDSSEVTGPWGAEAPDVIIVGGYGIERDSKALLLEEIAQVKSQHGLDPDCPVKWNLRDLRRQLAADDVKETLPQLLACGDPLRRDLVDALVRLQAKSFFSIIRAYSNKKEVLSETQRKLSAFSFGNLLMRVGKFRNSHHRAGNSCEVVLDWPAANDRRPFVDEYRCAWRLGTSTGSNVTYKCGALRNLGFYPSPVFSVMELDPLLQLADIAVGATRCFLDFALGRITGDTFGVQCFKRLLPTIWHINGNVIGNGLTVSQANSDLSTALLQGLGKIP
jgi:hypothetical protein